MVKLVADKPWPADGDARLSKVGCIVPFRHLEILSSGDVVLCCHTWLPEHCGNLLGCTVDELLVNAKRLEIMSNMRRGRFDHCTNHCPRIDEHLAFGNNHVLKPLDQLDDHVATMGYQIYLCYDHSCNLQCPSCRTKLIVYKPDDISNHKVRKMNAIHDKVRELVMHLINQGHKVELNITGSGDAFASPLYWSYLLELASMELPDRFTLSLCTNGVLMDAEAWADIAGLLGHITSISVSVDAATEKTYSVVRKNGNWEKLRANLANLDSMIGRNDFPALTTWQTNMVVQRDNFMELRQFVEWQLGYRNLTNVHTNLIAQWYHLSDDDYKSMAIWRSDNPQHAMLLEILDHPVFDNPRVLLGNMATLRHGFSPSA